MACAGPGKASEKTGTWKRTFGVRGLKGKVQGVVATAGRGRRGNGAGGVDCKILGAREGAKKLELM